MKFAIKEAKTYARGLPDCSFFGYVDLFELYTKPTEMTEVFSAMQQSDLPTDQYLDRYVPVDLENCEAVGREHRYYNKGGGKSACYHCRIIKRGKLWKKASKVGGSPKVLPN
jgi:hypothetical protein